MGGRVNTMKTAAGLCALLCGVAAASPLLTTSIPLAVFDGSSSLSWTAVNDPVMGGQSYSNLTVDKADSVLDWIGEVKIVPFLHAPGFCNAQAPGLGEKADFPSVEGAKGLVIRARTIDESLTHFNTILMTKGAQHWMEQGQYSANWTASSPWRDVYVPWSDFDCTWRGEHVSWCPELDTQLAGITNIGVGTAFPGSAGKFHVQIHSITAVSVPPSA